jgi:hypothetical protein
MSGIEICKEMKMEDGQGWKAFRKQKWRMTKNGKLVYCIIGDLQT